MNLFSVISEFNPFHNGHKYLIKSMREQGATHIVAIMSGNFTQRGEPTIISKYARTKSALFGNIPVVQMPENNLTVAIQTGDASASFVKEGELIPDSEPIFDKVSLLGKTLAIYVPVSEQLLDSAPNIS